MKNQFFGGIMVFTHNNLYFIHEIWKYDFIRYSKNVLDHLYFKQSLYVSVI